MVAAVSMGDASSFQAQYQQLIENWVQAWLALREQQNFEENKDENKVNEEADALQQFKQEEVEITQKLSDNREKLLYGKDTQENSINLLTPELITALDQAKLSDKLDAWGAITIRAGDEILFQSNESGKVIVNRRVNLQNMARVDTQERVTAVDSSHSKGNSVPNNASEMQEGVKATTVEPYHSEGNSVPSNVSGRQDVVEEDFSSQFRQDDLTFDSDSSREQNNSVSQDTTGTQNDRDVYLQVLSELMVPLVWEAMREPESSSSILNKETKAPQENLPQKDEEFGLFEEFFVASFLIKTGQERQESARSEKVLNSVTRSNEQNNENISVGVKVPSQFGTEQAEQKATQTGLDALFAATSELLDSPVKQVLQETTNQMQSALLEQQSSPPSVAMQELVERRLQCKDNLNWWQQLKTKVEVIVIKVKDEFTQHRSASTLKQFANSIDLRMSESYEAANYTFSKQGKKYTLSDKQGNPLLQFKSTVFGVKVDKSLPPLSEADFAKTEQLRADIITGKSPRGAFNSQAVSEGSRLAQIQRIQAAMSDFANQTSKADIQVEGSIYNWRANSKGSAIIQDKQGNVLLATGNGFIRSSMNDKQLSDFEQMLTVASSRTKSLQKKAPESQLTAKSKTKDKSLELN